MAGGLKEAGLQESVRTNRNCIRGMIEWVSNHIFVKPVANKLFCVDAADIDFKDPEVSGPGEISTLFGREVSRSHSTVIVFLLREGLKVNPFQIELG